MSGLIDAETGGWSLAGIFLEKSGARSTRALSFQHMLQVHSGHSSRRISKQLRASKSPKNQYSPSGTV